MRVRFWGTRGSIPTPGPGTLQYGGNTLCVEVRTQDNTLLILDTGTGLREMGIALMAREPKPIKGHILLSHTHWDHIQGFPFFSPLYVPGSEFVIYGAQDLDKRLEDALADQMEHAHFPVGLDQLPAKLTFREIGRESFTAGSATVRSRYMNHSAVCVGYRIECDGRTLVYATDTEPYFQFHHNPTSDLNQDAQNPVGDEAVRGHFDHLGDYLLAKFARDADLLIFDAQYTAEEYESHRGWGHSYLDYVLDVAKAAQVKRLALYHHDPLHDDGFLASLEAEGQRRCAADAPGMAVFAAAEGAEIAL